MLWACILLPSLPLDVFARAAPDDAQRPFVVASGGHYPRVVAANGCAHAAGIRRDQLISAALAFAPDVVLRDRDPGAETAALAEVATLLLAMLVERVESRGYVARMALAPTPTAALLLARAGHAQPVPRCTALPDVLAPLPLALLDLEPGT